MASWFDDVTVDGLRRRLRANVEVGGVPAFWEDRFVGADAPAFRAGSVRFEGVTPCGRCVVPQRDPDTGKDSPTCPSRPSTVDSTSFRRGPSGRLRRSLHPDAIARVPEADRDAALAVGDPVEVVSTTET